MQLGQILDDFTALPLEAQTQVVDFIAFLRQRYKKQEIEVTANSLEISQEPFIGMWQNRTDIQDSTAWVRELRKEEWK